QQEQPDDYVIATEETHSVREFLECAFGMLDLDPYKYLVLDPALARPAEVDLLLGDMTKARQRLQWSPRMHFRDLVRTMVNSDLQLYSRNEPTAGAAVLPASTERQRARHANTNI
ncbi:MAG: GDP-mannose 4,6-dehydratase, partial [Candidatus Acidiferrales bacterium]